MTAPRRGGDVWTRLARVRRGPAIVLALVVVLAGLFVPGPAGGVLLLALAVGLALLMRHTWAVTPTSMRPMRVLVLAVLFLVALWKIAGGAW